MPEGDRILPGAFSELPKTVPVVVYTDGVRKVIGEGTLEVSPDDRGVVMKAHITDPASLNDALKPTLEGFSIAHKPKDR